MVLEKIKKILEQEEFNCSLFSPTNEFPYERLVAFMGIDTEKRERMLEVVASQQQMAPELLLPQTSSPPYRVQFKVRLPFKAEDSALSQVASLLLFLNQFIDLPGFELDELNGLVTYRYVWIITSEAIDPSLIMNITTAILLNLSLFSETIESLAKGKVSFNDLLSQIVQLVDKTRSSQSNPPI